MKFTRQTIHRAGPAERVLCVVGDIDGDGQDEVVIGQRAPEGKLIWLDSKRDGTWREHLIDDGFGRLEAGGVLHDLDGDGLPDLVAGADGLGNELWWWQNPGDPTRPWVRREIFRLPAPRSHDQLVADLDGDGRAELYFWNQSSKTLFYVPVPDDPRAVPWPAVAPVAADVIGEGLVLADVDGDGNDELVAGLSWYKPRRDGSWESHAFAEGFIAPRLAVADIDGDGVVEIVLSEGDASQHGRQFGRVAVCKLQPGSDPRQPWEVRILHDALLDPHSLAIADFDRDGQPDVFVGELGDPGGQHVHRPALRVLLNRGTRFEEHMIERTEFGVHEARVIRVDAQVGIIGKPYRSIDSPGPRPPDVDSIHLWLPEVV